MLLDTTNLKIDILQIQKKLENHDNNIELVFSYLDELSEKKENEKPRTKIGYKKKTNKRKKIALLRASQLLAMTNK